MEYFHVINETINHGGLRSIIHGETSVRVFGINVDVQFCTAEKPKFIKHVLVLNIVKTLADVVLVNVNSCVPPT